MKFKKSFIFINNTYSISLGTWSDKISISMIIFLFFLAPLWDYMMKWSLISYPESRWNISIIGVNLTIIYGGWKVRLHSLWRRLLTPHLRTGGNINNIFIKSTPDPSYQITTVKSSSPFRLTIISIRALYRCYWLLGWF